MHLAWDRTVRTESNNAVLCALRRRITAGGPPSDKGPGSGHYEHKKKSMAESHGFHQISPVLRQSQGTRNPEGYLTGKPAPDSGVSTSCLFEKAFTKIIGMTPQEFTDHLMSNFKREDIIDGSMKIRGGNPDKFNIGLSCNIKMGEGRAAHVDMDREIDYSRGVVEHQFFQVKNAVSVGKIAAKDVQASGVGKKLFAASLDLYDHMGINKITVHANLDVGGYAWARYGFVPEKTDWDSLRQYGLISTPMGRKSPERWYIKDTKVRATVLKILASEDPRSLAVLAAIKAPASEAGSKTIGQQLLKGTQWDGSMNLANKDAYKQVRAYVGGTA